MKCKKCGIELKEVDGYTLNPKMELVPSGKKITTHDFKYQEDFEHSKKQGCVS